MPVPARPSKNRAARSLLVSAAGLPATDLEKICDGTGRASVASLAAGHGQPEVHRRSFQTPHGRPNALQTELQNNPLFLSLHMMGKISHVENQYAARTLCG
jgi:hypothetical protein